MRLKSAIYFAVEGETVKLCAEVEHGQLERDVQLSIIALPGSAQREDYTMSSFSFSFGSTQNQSCIPVEILKDNLVEGEESFHVALSTSDPAVITSTPDSAIVYIEDNNGNITFDKGITKIT